MLGLIVLGRTPVCMTYMLEKSRQRPPVLALSARSMSQPPMLAHGTAVEPTSEAEARVEGSMMLGRFAILLIHLGRILAVEVEVEA
mmetsp:Transcript_56247/g.146649  ORF Transcript_56247/g.146649 Transcript_56247/m.146649 type:complete len:86 (-) Transcript_56247:671-928(-)